MSRILADVEHGAVVLIHDIAEHPTMPEDIPEVGLKAAAALATRLGLNIDELSGLHVGWLFDLLDHTIGAMNDAREADTAPAEAAKPEAEVHAPAGAAEAASAAETEVSAPAAAGSEGPTPGTSPSLEGQAPPPAPADTDADAQHSAKIDEAIARASQEWGSQGTAAGE